MSDPGSGTVPRSAWLPSYLILALIWGCSFYFIKLGLLALTPAGVAMSRLLFGLLTMVVVSLLTRTRPAPRRLWGPIFVAAALMSSLPWMLFAFGEERISSALAGIINAATPLTTLAAILLAFTEERPTRQRVAGLLTGFVGILMVLGVWQGLGSATWVGIAACLGAICLYGVSYPYVRRNLTGGARAPNLAPIALATALMAMGFVQSIPFVALTGFAVAPITGVTVAGMLALGVLGSGIAYVLNFRVIRASDATTASTVTYLTPLVAVSAGALLLGEQITWNEPVGALLVIAGAALAQGLVRVPWRSAS